MTLFHDGRQYFDLVFQFVTKTCDVKQFSKDFRVCPNEFHDLDLIKKK